MLFHRLALAKRESPKNVMVGVPTKDAKWYVPVEVLTKSLKLLMYLAKKTKKSCDK